MAHTYTTSFASELADAIHDLDTDTLKIALYSSSASLSAATTAYATTNEISGTGYTAGGVTLTLKSGYPQTAGNGVGRLFTFNDAEWTVATFSASYGLIYNSSKANRSILVLDFGGSRVVNVSTFAVRFPASLPALIRIGG